jgi:hypothetical protein
MLPSSREIAVATTATIMVLTAQVTKLVSVSRSM